jgi:hypothetical protein
MAVIPADAGTWLADIIELVPGIGRDDGLKTADCTL